ncbi:GATA transcription factor 8-like [Impatiens glandulifera]|uniref:GATA transcription factor 8-like n=1 Tax=Impatiens glandulifera TaxID=253017 RepID=UPI001FB123A3|nr:GATA transcription factor 8-like [Impatiens glandulifera]
MKENDFSDEIDCGNLFDQIDDFIDFPTDNNASFNSNDFSTIWSNSPFNETADPIFSGDHTNTTAAGAAVSNLPVPVTYEEMIQLEWLSNFFEKEDSLSDYNRAESSPFNPFNSLSPISVLESSTTPATATTITTTAAVADNSSCSGGKTQRGPRSKRTRPVTFTFRTITTGEEEEEPKKKTLIPITTGEEEEPMKKSLIPIITGEEEPKKKKKKKNKECSSSSSSSSSDNQLAAAIRKCMHCQITKTPQWRMGPMGPKTLCNACGVRFKSGRLFPEYRPAASPTFVHSLHSNSHKKVIEMRTVAPSA